MQTKQAQAMGPNPKPPFRKINLLSRKAKDERTLESLKDKDGSGIIRSKGKVNDPNTGAPLQRGSLVRSHVSSTLVKTPDKTIAGETKTTMVPKTTEKFVAGDRNPDKINDRTTTPELGKSLKENPGKTMARINVQKAAESGSPEKGGGRRVNDAVAYDYGKNKNEYAGRYDKKTEMTPVTTKSPDKVIPGKVETIKKRQITVTAPKQQPKSTGHQGLTIQRVAGVNRKGQGQNYNQLKIGTLPLAKWRTKTKGTGR